MFEITISETNDVVKKDGDAEKTTTETNEVFMQQVEKLDIKAVIKTINDISGY